MLNIYDMKNIKTYPGLLLVLLTYLFDFGDDLLAFIRRVVDEISVHQAI